MSEYDSTEDTKKHIENVQGYMREVINELTLVAVIHDASKLESPEKEYYDKYTPKLSSVTYGSDEYKQFLIEANVGFQHHYEHNRHHPEHFKNGIQDMTLLDLIEMLCDWKAASMRVKDGDLQKSLEYNRERFQIYASIYRILENTARYLGWI